MSYTIRRHLLGAALAGAVFTAPALAQGGRYDLDARPQRGPSRTYIGGGLTVSQPVGEFESFVGNGIGFNLHVLQGLDRKGLLGVRLDLGYLIYGHETQRTRPFPRIEADVTTDNNIFLAAIGPQFMMPNGRFRPYVNGTVGLAYFFTRTSIDGKDDSNDDDLFGTNNHEDATFAVNGAAGFYIPVTHGKNPLSIDIGARYHGNGTAEYLREGSIVDNPDNSYTKTVLRSKTQMVTYHLGVSVRL